MRGSPSRAMAGRALFTSEVTVRAISGRRVDVTSRTARHAVTTPGGPREESRQRSRVRDLRVEAPLLPGLGKAIKRSPGGPLNLNQAPEPTRPRFRLAFSTSAEAAWLS